MPRWTLLDLIVPRLRLTLHRIPFGTGFGVTLLWFGYTLNTTFYQYDAVKAVEAQWRKHNEGED